VIYGTRTEVAMNQFAILVGDRLMPQSQ
jgi:hypothetical protein